MSEACSGQGPDHRPDYGEPRSAADALRRHFRVNLGREKPLMRRPVRLLALGTVVAAAVAFPAVAAATVSPGTYTTSSPGSFINYANAPQGTHFANGSTAPTCIVASDLSISCGDGANADQPYTLGGVGHTRATLNLVATYTEQVQCTNHGKQVVEAQQRTAGLPGGPQTWPSDKNGNTTVTPAA